MDSEEATGVAERHLNRGIQRRQVGGHERGIGAGLDEEILERNTLESKESNGR